MRTLLEKHGLHPYDIRSISLIQEYESEKVGYSFRGPVVKLMTGFAETLSTHGLKERFSKISDTRGLIFLEKTQ